VCFVRKKVRNFVLMSYVIVWLLLIVLIVFGSMLNSVMVMMILFVRVISVLSLW